jgi:hypothetical protein
LQGKILRTSTVAAVKDHVAWCELVGEAVILHLRSSIYYGLNRVGARVWSLIQEPKTVGAISNTLLEQYDVAPDRCETELLDLLKELHDRELIEVKPEANGTAA